MLISLNWLKDFIDIPRSISPEELGTKLTLHTVEIDSVESQAEKFKNIVVGKVIEVKKHPNADKLKLVKVEIKADTLEIVCGAPNLASGQFVPVALVGAELPNGMKIEPTEIRGVKSNGMICAEDELGLGDDHTGIMVLNKKAKIGQNFADYLGVSDVVFEVDNKSISHRPDLWSHLGLARDMSAFLETKFKELKIENKIKKDKPIEKVDVGVDDFKLCPRYMAVKIEAIEIARSPKWIEDRLIAVGVRPINNIVDITNYVMLEVGQPLHAFDSSLVDKIIIRRAKKGEAIETIDNEKRELDSEMLVIADSKKPIALAGIMGGANSEISDDSRSIIIESANFDFVSLRITSTKLGLRTEASQRFEKGLDPNLAEIAILRTIELIKKLCPKARVASELVDEKKYNLNQGPIDMSFEWLNNFVGETLEEKRVIKILERLGFEVKNNKGSLSVTVPTWRATRDISSKEDLAEEVVRIIGYNEITPKMPKIKMEVPEKNEERLKTREIKQILIGSPAFVESNNYSFVGEEQLKKLGVDFSQHIELANPIASHQTMLRQSLIPNLLENIKLNQSRFEGIKLFEIGSIFTSINGELEKDNDSNEKLPYQEKRLGLVEADDKKGIAYDNLKGTVDHLFSNLNLEIKFEKCDSPAPWADTNFSTQININGKIVGFINKLDEKIQKKLGIKKETVAAEINLVEVYNLTPANSATKFKEFEKYPPLIRDLAIVVNEKTLYNDIKEKIENFHDYITEVELFDVYQGEKIGKAKKSLAFHITYRAEKTLTQEEVDAVQNDLIKNLEKKFEAKVRDF